MRRTLPALLFLLALSARWVVVARTPCLFSDGPLYIYDAQEIDAGRLAGMHGSNIHPLYPALIALAHRVIAPARPRTWQEDRQTWEDAAYLITVALAAFAVFPIIGIGTRLFTPRIGLLTGFVYALTPYLARESARITTVGTYLFFAALALWLLLRTLDGERPLLSAALAGACAGLAYLVRPDGLAFLPIAAAAIALSPRPPNAGARWPALVALVLPIVAGVALYLCYAVHTGHAATLSRKLSQKEWRGVAGRVFSLRPPPPPAGSEKLAQKAARWDFPLGQHLFAVGAAAQSLIGCMHAIGTGLFLLGAAFLCASPHRGRRTWVWLGGALFLFLLLALYTLVTLRISKRYPAGVALLLLPVQAVAFEGVARLFARRGRGCGAVLAWALLAYTAGAGYEVLRPVSAGKTDFPAVGRAIAADAAPGRPCILCNTEQIAWYADADRLDPALVKGKTYDWAVSALRSYKLTHLVVDAELEETAPELARGLRPEDWLLIKDTRAARVYRLLPGMR